jgi:hypothetical protein
MAAAERRTVGSISRFHHRSNSEAEATRGNIDVRLAGNGQPLN